MQLQAPLVMLYIYMVVKEPGNVRYESMGVLDTPDDILPVKLLRLFIVNIWTKVMGFVGGGDCCCACLLVLMVFLIFSWFLLVEVM